MKAREIVGGICAVVGFIAIAIGGCALDSANIIAPVAICLFGMAFLFAGVKLID